MRAASAGGCASTNPPPAGHVLARLAQDRERDIEPASASDDGHASTSARGAPDRARALRAPLASGAPPRRTLARDLPRSLALGRSGLALRRSACPAAPPGRPGAGGPSGPATGARRRRRRAVPRRVGPGAAGGDRGERRRPARSGSPRARARRPRSRSPGNSRARPASRRQRPAPRGSPRARRATARRAARAPLLRADRASSPRTLRSARAPPAREQARQDARGVRVLPGAGPCSLRTFRPPRDGLPVGVIPAAPALRPVPAGPASVESAAHARAEAQAAAAPLGKGSGSQPQSAQGTRRGVAHACGRA